MRLGGRPAVLFPPFRTRAAHIVKLGAIRIEQVMGQLPGSFSDPDGDRMRKIFGFPDLCHDTHSPNRRRAAFGFLTAPEIDGMVALDRLKTGRHGEDLCEQRFHYLTSFLYLHGLPAMLIGQQIQFSGTSASAGCCTREAPPGEKKKMRIAQIAPLMESVPPRLYGGTERIVSYLTEELVRMGHDVTLFASGDSMTAAKLVGCVPQALRLDSNVRDTIPYYMLMLDRVRQHADEFDILHFHIDQFHFPLFRPIAGRTVTTAHGRQDLPDLKPLYIGFSDMPLISISNAQRQPIPNANFAKTIYHGLPADLYKPVFNPRGGYVAFLGRIAPEKRPDRAIQIARTLGIPLKIAAKVDRVDESYFREVIAPLLDGPGVEFIGEINEQQKGEFLGEALALLFPVDWPEPFGLSMIEAMACGTPVLGFRRGSVPEVIDEGVTGAIVESIEEGISALPHVIALDRRTVRQRFEERFSASRMAKDYVGIYRSLLKRSQVEPKDEDVRLAPDMTTDAPRAHIDS
jgi:glycosyltransferase involved in cell wall biosynthesis